MVAAGAIRGRRHALVALLVVQLAVAFDLAALTSLLPSMREDLGLTGGAGHWLVTGYAISFGGFVLLGGRVADVVGRRTTLLGGLAGFALGAAVATLAHGAGAIVAARALQGLAVAFVSPSAVSLLTTTFREGRERTFALGVWASVAGLGAAIGTTAGGLFDATVGWQLVFALDVPLAAAAALLVRSAFPRDVRTARSLDLPGALLVTTALASGVLGVSNAITAGWLSPVTLAGLGAATLAGLAFVAVEGRASDPLLPLAVVRAPCVSHANIVALGVAATAASMLVLLSSFVRDVLGLSPAAAAATLVVVPGTAAAWALVATRVVGRIGPRSLLTVGLSLLAVGLAGFARTPGSAGLTEALPGLLLAPAGMAFSFVALNVAALSSVPPVHAGLGSGLFAASQQVGGALGVALLLPLASIGGEGAVAAGAAGAAGSAGLSIAFWGAAAIAAGTAVAGFVLLGSHVCVGIRLRGRSSVAAPSPASA